MKRNEVREKLEQAIKQLYVQMRASIKNRVNERTLVSYLAHICLQPLFEGWDIDIEYNREGDFRDIKQDLSGKRIVPDIIIHSRGNIDGPNLVAIEVKGFWNKDKEGRKKDRSTLLTLREKYGYNFLYELELGLDSHKLMEID